MDKAEYIASLRRIIKDINDLVYQPATSTPGEEIAYAITTALENECYIQESTSDLK